MDGREVSFTEALLMKRMRKRAMALLITAVRAQAVVRPLRTMKRRRSRITRGVSVL
jgi:hypothetical protein